MADYGPFGGDGGSDFDDSTIGDMNQLELGIIYIRAVSNRFVNSIEVLYRNPHTGRLVPGDHHGGESGTLQDPIILEPGEYIVEVLGGAGQFVDSITLQTNLGRQFGRFGGGGGSFYDVPLPTVPGVEVFAFFGRSGTLLDAIGFKTRPRIS